MGIFPSASQSTHLTINPAYHQQRRGIHTSHPLYQQSVAGAAEYRQQYTEIEEIHSGVRSTSKFSYCLALLSILSLVFCVALTIAMSIEIVKLRQNVTANSDQILQLKNQVQRDPPIKPENLTLLANEISPSANLYQGCIQERIQCTIGSATNLTQCSTEELPINRSVSLHNSYLQYYTID